MTKQNKFWAIAAVFLIAVIITGSILAWSRYSPNQPIEISLPPQEELQGEIYISGAVNNPGLYPFRDKDNIGDIIKAAGGTTGSAELNRITIYVPDSGETDSPQKVDINRAEAWLLQALPGIGETRAQAIIDYRRQNGEFKHITELTKVKGIGITTYEHIKHLITVAD
jgi:competence protein ComEA